MQVIISIRRLYSLMIMLWSLSFILDYLGPNEYFSFVKIVFLDFNHQSLEFQVLIYSKIVTRPDWRPNHLYSKTVMGEGSISRENSRQVRAGRAKF